MSNVLLQVDAKYEGRSALHQAAGVGNFALVKLLLEFGANVEIQVGIWISQKPTWNPSVLLSQTADFVCSTTTIFIL